MEREEAELWAIFHTFYKDYSERTCDQVNTLLDIYRILEHKFKFFGKINVLDIGCGKSGMAISTLVTKHPGKIRGFGVDLDIQTYPDNVELHQVSAKKLPFEDLFFDVAYACDVLYYTLDENSLVEIVHEALRVMKKKGCLALNDSRGAAFYKNTILPRTWIRAKVLEPRFHRILIMKY
jgi:SAM-dependent methyltransferase